MEIKERKFYAYFQINCDSTRIGDNLYVTGNLKCLGEWNINKSIKLHTSLKIFPIWKSKLFELKCCEDKFEYKFFIKDINYEVKWEKFEGNRIIMMDDIDFLSKKLIEYTVEIHDDTFGEKKKSLIFISPLKDYKIIIDQAHMEENTNELYKQLEFLNSKDYLSQIIEEIVSKNNACKSWRDKINFVYNLLISSKYVDNHLLALVSIYLFFINTEKIKSSKDISHYTLYHHSSLTNKIFIFLLHIINDDNALIVRSIMKNLPSFSDQYMVQYPLSRIRDIAHRNDIPNNLKTEIKKNLQNKLHRSASPDDLITCEKILTKVSSGNYSEDFVNELRIFYGELVEFFKAVGLENLLNKLKQILPNNKRIIIENMIKSKNEVTDKYKSLEKLRNVNSTRKMLQEIINDININNISLIQNSCITDIKLENFSYTIMSEYIEKFYFKNKCFNTDGYQILIELCIICLENLSISSINKHESEIIRDDLVFFSTGFKFDDFNRLQVLKIKSVLERCQNFFYEISENVNKVFKIPVNSLGKALMIDPHSIKVFCESLIRSHTIFQMSKIVSLLLSKSREILNIPNFITISAETVNGHYLHLDKLSDFDPDTYKEFKEYIIFANSSDGSEEIHDTIKGVVLLNDLPQLSHLAIRARQNKVAFICCLDAFIFKYDNIKKYILGEYITLNVTANDQMKIKKCSNVVEKVSSTYVKDDKVQSLIIFNNDEINKFTREIHGSTIENILLNVTNADKELSGNKCCNIKALTYLQKYNGTFYVPVSYSVPFWVYFKYISSIVNSKEIYDIDNCKFGDIEKKAEILREKIIYNCLHSDYQYLDLIVKEIVDKLPPFAYLAVRSSSNLEDLKKSASAGLFDSYLGTQNIIENKSIIKENISKVWASMFTLRGLIARRNSKISSYDAMMGVLVQEMIDLHICFIVHTVNPINRNTNEVYIEMAIGLGETLANANVKGSPYRLIYKKHEKEIIVNNFASFSKMIIKGKNEEKISYKNQILHTDNEYLINIGKRIGKIAVCVEYFFNGEPQDIEGGVIDDKIYLMQARTQIL